VSDDNIIVVILGEKFLHIMKIMKTLLGSFYYWDTL